MTRCSNNYGPYQFPEKLIPLMIIKALRDEPLPVYGDGMNVRDWIHVEDHCAGIVAALFEGKPGAVYNFGGDGEMANLDVVKLILERARQTGEPDLLRDRSPRARSPLRDRFLFRQKGTGLASSPHRARRDCQHRRLVSGAPQLVEKPAQPHGTLRVAESTTRPEPTGSEVKDESNLG